MSVPVPLCLSCVYLNREGPGMVCAAYPSGIPDEILDSDVDHRLPYTGDNGIQFVQAPGAPPPDLTAFEGTP